MSFVISAKLFLHLSQAFVVDEAAISRLFSVVNERVGGSPTIQIKARDGTTLVYDSIEQFLLFPNTHSRRIVELDIGARRSNPYKYLSIKFNKEESYLSILLTGEASDEEIVLARRELLEVVESSSVHYSFIATSRFGISIFAGVLLPVLAAALAYPAIKELLLFYFPRGPSAIWLIVMLAACLFLYFFAIYLVGNLVEKSLRFLFPIGIVLVGDEQREHRARLSARNILGVSFFLALLVSVVASYLTKVL
jgi:hypothetical protein